MSRPFKALYAGKCAADCGIKVDVGDTVRFDDEYDVLIHAHCVIVIDNDFEPVTASATCGTCWITLPCFCEVD